MTTLEDARKNIEEIDKKIASLYEQRMNQVKDIAEYKYQNKIPIKDEVRQSYLLEKNCDTINNEDIKKYYKKFLKSIFDDSCAYQKELMEKSSKHFN